MSEIKETLVTPVGKLVFDKNLFEADEKGKFRAALVFEDSINIKEIESLCAAVAKEKWPNGLPSGLKRPVKRETRQDMIEKYPFMKNSVLLNASTKFEVQVLDRHLNEIFKGDVKAGDMCRFSISAWAYDANGNKGIGLNLLGVQKIQDGEPLFNRVSARQTFGGSDIPQEFTTTEQTTDDNFEGFSFS